jgi:orotidine-5'-phosphate decarboxylase
MKRHFAELSHAQWADEKYLCVGLDPDLSRIPDVVRRGSASETICAFNRAIVDATADLAGAYKPNSAFFESQGSAGWDALKETIAYIHEVAPSVPVILDCKRGDIGSTNLGYVAAAFDDLRADSITVHPYLGKEALAPFLDRADKGIFVLCRTSNAGSSMFQDLVVDGMPLYQKVAQSVSNEWNVHMNCGLVVGATYPQELRSVRTIAPEIPILIPGIGTQGGDLEQSVKNGLNAKGEGILVSVSRSLLYASTGDNFADAARSYAQTLHSEIKAAAIR